MSLRVRGIVILVGMLAFHGCTKCRPPNGDTRHDAKPRKVPKICDRFFELGVEVKHQEAITILRFSYPDLYGRVARVNDISIDKVEGDEQDTTFCRLKAKDLAGPLITGTWVLGTVPPNYTVKGCYQASLGPGNYEVHIRTDRFESSRRMRVEPDGQIDILNWEDLSDEECEAALKMKDPGP